MFCRPWTENCIFKGSQTKLLQLRFCYRPLPKPAGRQLRRPRRRRQLARPTVARGPDLRLLVFRTSTFCTAASLGIVLQNFILRVGYQLCNCCEKNAKLHRARQSTAARRRRRPTHVQSHMYHSPLETDSRQHKLFRCCNLKEGFFYDLIVTASLLSSDPAGSQTPLWIGLSLLS